MTHITVNCFRQTSLFENGTVDLQYDYAEDLKDGRGWTCGICGFTREDFEPFLPFFKQKEWRLPNFNLLWKSAARTDRFKQAQRVAAHELFGLPAVQFFDRHGFVHETSLAVLYDTFVQHGESETFDSYYMDSASAILRLTEAQVKAKSIAKPVGEREFISLLLKRRYSVLMNASNPETQKVWRESADRVVELEKVNTTGKFTWER